MPDASAAASPPLAAIRRTAITKQKSSPEGATTIPKDNATTTVREDEESRKENTVNASSRPSTLWSRKVIASFGAFAVLATISLVAMSRGKLGFGRRTALDNPRELLSHVAAIADKSILYSDLQVDGVHLNDAESAINPAHVKSAKDADGFVVSDDHVGYHIVQGRVAAITFDDAQAPAKAGFIDVNSLQQKFGELGRVHKLSTGAVRAVDFDDRHVVFHFDNGVVYNFAMVVELQSAAELKTFALSIKPFAVALKSLSSRIELGINYNSFEQKLGELTDAYAQIGKVPDDDEHASLVVTNAKLALDYYKSALDEWLDAVSDSDTAFLSKRSRDDHLQHAADATELFLREFQRYDSLVR